MAFGAFTELTFNNGGAPAIDEDALNDMQSVLAQTDEELARSGNIKFSEMKEYFYERNTNQFIFFDDYTEWSVNFASTTTISNEIDNNLMDNGAIKVLSTTNSVAYLEIVRSGLSFDFTAFFDGSPSDINDCLNLIFYVSDYSLIAGIFVDIGDDASNHYRLYIPATGDGWNSSYPEKSDFAEVGAPTGWDSVSWIRMAPYCNANSSGEYCYLQSLTLGRKDPIYSGYANPFQKYKGAVTGWVNSFEIINDVCLLYKDRKDSIDRIGWMKVDRGLSETQLKIVSSIINFILKVEIYCKNESNSPSITWFYNSSNYIETYVDGGTLYLDVTEAGVLTTESIALETTLLKDERFYLYVEKNYETIRVILKKDGEIIKILEYETSISADVEGDLYFGKYNTNMFGIITDFEYTTRPVVNLIEENLPRYIRKKEDQSISNNTVVDISGMFSYLKTHKTYRVDVIIVATSSSTAPDFKISWALTDCEMIDGNRHTIGPTLGTLSLVDTNVTMTSTPATTSLGVGVGASAIESYTNEIFYVKTNHGNPSIQLRGAQNTTTGGSPTVVKAMSNMLITEIVPQE
jgi:hypothetical protein